MIILRDRMGRGHTRTSWLDSRHTFSFGDYRDPEQMGFRSLRVINDDRIARGGGFPPHSHRDMEIVTYVLEGALEHKDSLGNSGVIRAGDVQRMTAGAGITHSEFNPSETEPTHFLQIWILPNRLGLPPGYEQKSVPVVERRGVLRVVGSPDGRNDSVVINQDAFVFAAYLVSGERVVHELAPGRGAWLQIAQGVVALDGVELREGDGAAIQAEPAIAIEARGETELLLFDLA